MDTLTPSQLRDRLAARNGPRKSVYWVRKGDPDPDSSNQVTKQSKSYTVTGKYTGHWVDGMKHGYGVYEYSDGSKYEGYWKEDRRDGEGTLYIPVGKGKKPKLRKEYCGEWQLGKRDGLGESYEGIGRKYYGEWRRGKKQGKGKMFYEDDSVYDGDWESNERSGFGVYRMANGDVYEGYWSEDKKEGPGRHFYASTNKLYEGEWANDTPYCGSYASITDDSPYKALSSDLPAEIEASSLPFLELQDPEHVIRESIARIRFNRSSSSSSELPLDDSTISSIITAFIEKAETIQGDRNLDDEDYIFGRSLHQLYADANVSDIDTDDFNTLIRDLQIHDETRLTLQDCLEIASLVQSSFQNE